MTSLIKDAKGAGASLCAGADVKQELARRVTSYPGHPKKLREAA